MNPHDILMVSAGAVLTLIFTGVARWIFKLFDAVVPISKAPDKLRAVMDVKANRDLLWESLIMLGEIYLIVWFALDKGPITRLSILFGAVLVSVSLFILFALMLQIQFHSIRRKRERVRAASSTADIS